MTRTRAFPLAAAVATLVAAAVLPATLPAPAAINAARVTFMPRADAYVDADDAADNFGASSKLSVDDEPRRAFIRFEVSGVNGDVTQATLRLHVGRGFTAGSDHGGTLRTVSDSGWSEDSITFSNQPSIDGPVVARLGRVERNTWYEIDVTSAVQGNGDVGFGITSDDGNKVTYDSKESDGGSAPQLVVSSGGSTTTSSTAPPSSTTSTSTTSTSTTSTSTTSTSTTSTTMPAPSDEVLVGAGDIAACGGFPPGDGGVGTADLLDNIPGTVFTAGDNAYPDGSDADYSSCYDPSWGRHKARTRPTPGNHEYNTADASGYFNYFGSTAGEPGRGYSYDLGNWHVVAINSNCSSIGGCAAGSPQEQWLRQDLAANTRPCTVAYWHHPRFSSGQIHGSTPEMAPIFQALYDNHAEIVVSGHEHQYERFAPQDPDANADPDHGIRQFVAGTGGAFLYAGATPLPNSEVRNGATNGLLKLTLSSSGYAWEFVPVEGQSFTDSGTGTCH